MTNSAEFSAREISRANNEWDKLSAEARESLLMMISRLSHPVYGLKVQKLAKTMFIINHPTCEYGIMLNVVAHGSNLDISLHAKDESKIRNYITTVKLHHDNVMFGVNRVRATLGLFDDPNDNTDNDPAIRHNNYAHKQFVSEYNFINKYEQ